MEAGRTPSIPEDVWSNRAGEYIKAGREGSAIRVPCLVRWSGEEENCGELRRIAVG